MNPQNASNAEIGRPIFDTDIGTEKGPINTGHRVNSLQRWPNATAAKIDAETAAYILSSLIGFHRAMTASIRWRVGELFLIRRLAEQRL